jgi:hypothetical protein
VEEEEEMVYSEQGGAGGRRLSELVNTLTDTRDSLSSLHAEDFSNNLPVVRHVIAAHLLYPNLNPKPQTIP